MPFIQSMSGSASPLGRGMQRLVLGGDSIFNTGSYKVHVFTTTGSNNLTILNAPIVNAEILMVGAGGGAAITSQVASDFGGGSGGGYVVGTIPLLTPGVYSISVGAGGTSPSAGGNTTFLSYIAKGGNSSTGNSGGSLGASTGGAGLTANGAFSGGGWGGQIGGGGGAGSTANGSIGGTGGGGGGPGAGYTSSITGTSLVYGTGGWGGWNTGGTQGTDGRGNGGGNGHSSRGGHGTFIIRYLL